VDRDVTIAIFPDHRAGTARSTKNNAAGYKHPGGALVWVW